MKPLTGLRILDLTEGAQGPFGISQLAELGATVLKLERPSGELTRTSGPFKKGVATPNLSMSCGRLSSVVIDVRTKEGYEEILELVRYADVFAQNWRGGVAEKLKLDYASLKEVNPKIIYLCGTGFGSSGPDALAGSYDGIASAAGALSSVNGEAGETPQKARFPLVDFMSGMIMAEMSLATILRAELSQTSQDGETSQLEAALSAVAPLLADSDDPTELDQTFGSGDRWCVPSGSFETADGAWVALHVDSDEQWLALVEALDLPNNPAWQTRRERRTHRSEIQHVVANALAQFALAQAVDILSRSGVPSTPVRRWGKQALADGLLVDRNMTARWHDEVGLLAFTRPPWDYRGLDITASAPGPSLGEKTFKEVIGDWSSAETAWSD